MNPNDLYSPQNQLAILDRTHRRVSSKSYCLRQKMFAAKQISITTLTNDSADQSLKMNADFLREHGFTGYRHFAYAYGKVNKEKDSVVRENCISARLVVGWPEGEVMPYADPHRLRILGFLDSKGTVSMAKSAVDHLVQNRTAGILGVHEIVKDGPLDSRKWYRADWEVLMDYIKGYVDQGRLKVYSLETFSSLFAGPKK